MNMMKLSIGSFPKQLSFVKANRNNDFKSTYPAGGGEERMEPVPSNGPELVHMNPGELVDLAPLGPFQITVFIMMLVAGIFQGYDNQALAYTTTDFAKARRMTPAALAVAFTAGLSGMMVGALLFGQLADRIGRRVVFIAAVSMLGVCTLITPFAMSVQALSIFRFVGGLGLGGIPAIIPSFISEFAPMRFRNSFGAWALSGIPIGGVLGGVVAATLAPSLGWQSVYLLGGALTALLAGLAFFTLPESPLFLLSHNRNESQALDTLRRITGTQTLVGIARAENTVTKKTTNAVHGLFGDGRLLMTLLFWLTTGVLLTDFYFLVNWTPTLLVHGGFSAKTAAFGSALLNVGGAVLGLGVWQFSDRWGGRRVVSAIFVAGGLSLALAGAASGSATLLMAMIVFAGAVWIAGQAAMLMLVARSYPDEIRATGVGWTLTAGHVAAMVSPALVAIPLGRGWTPADIVLIPVIPALLSAVAILCAAPPASGNRITDPKPAVKAATTSGE
jgi:AAHS family 4-hydroxybenzoate transporter-like MFS transporter